MPLGCLFLLCFLLCLFPVAPLFSVAPLLPLSLSFLLHAPLFLGAPLLLVSCADDGRRVRGGGGGGDGGHPCILLIHACMYIYTLYI